MNLEDIVFSAFALFMSVVGLALLYLFFVVLPVGLHADAKCKAAGYPRAEVTIYLDAYCMTLDGAVTIKMEKL